MSHDELETLLTGFALHADAFRDAQDKTIRPPVSTRDLPTLDEALTLTHTLGQGGMGEVRLGVQRALDREVAVKLLFEDAPPELAVRLIQEARIVGRLDHPHVIPVHDLHLRDGRPVLVMRRVRGVDWRTRMKEQPLEEGVRVLIAVCHAVAFAHERAILHRDIKPENVMLGAHGEVYLVDWGVAVTLVPAPGLPTVEDGWLAGTPGYMAPEMLSRARGPLTRASDVFLLGAVLYELLTGRPPNQGQNMRELAQSVLTPDRRYPEGVPAGLRDLAERAMSVDPTDRPTATGFREALEDWQRHAASASLAEAAWRRLEEGGTDVVFAFRQALEAWPENRAATEGLERAVSRVVRAELDAGRPDAAARALSELTVAPEALAAEVERAVAEAERARLELARYRRAHDGSAGMGLRRGVAVISLLAWAFLPLGLIRDPSPSWGALGLPAVVIVPLLGAVTWFGRDWVASVANRRMLGAMWAMVLGSGMLHVSHALAGVSPSTSMRVVNAVWVAATASIAASSDARWWPIVGCLAAGGLGGVIWPEHWAVLHTVANLGTAAGVLRLAWDPGPDR